MRVVQVKCPQCAAVLEPEPGVDRLSCPYCGASATIERDAAPVPRVPEELPVASPAERPAATPARAGWNNAIGGLVLLAMVGAIVGVWLYHRADEQDRANTAEWHGTTRALLADVNGDGVPEVVGRIRRLAADPVRESFAALDMRTGRKLWETPALPKLDGPHRTLAAVAGELLLFVDPGGTARAYGLADGKLRWEAQLGEAASAVFVLPDGTLRVSTIDGALHGLAPDGTPRPIEEGGPLGRRVAVDTGEPPSAAGELPSGLARAFADRGLTTGSAVAGGAPGQPWLVLGHRARGTPVPMLGAASDDGTVLWTADIPGSEPLAAASGTVDRDRIAATPDRAFAVYERGAGPDRRLQATALDRATGRRLWEVELPEAAPVSGVTVGNGVLYVSYWGQLAALDAETGRRLFVASPIR